MYGNRLKSLREKKNLLQKDLAKLLNINHDAYAQYEREYTFIPIKHLNTLCNYFNVSFDYIFEFTDVESNYNTKSEIDRTLSSKRLKDLRKKDKLTQEDLAKKLGVSRTTVTEYERGTNIIATSFLFSICKEYGVSADFMLGKKD